MFIVCLTTSFSLLPLINLRHPNASMHWLQSPFQHFIPISILSILTETVPRFIPTLTYIICVFSKSVKIRESSAKKQRGVIVCLPFSERSVPQSRHGPMSLTCNKLQVYMGK